MELKRVTKHPLSKHVAVLLMSKKMDADFNEEDQGANSEISFFALKRLKVLVVIHIAKGRLNIQRHSNSHLIIRLWLILTHGS